MAENRNSHNTDDLDDYLELLQREADKEEAEAKQRMAAAQQADGIPVTKSRPQTEPPADGEPAAPETEAEPAAPEAAPAEAPEPDFPETLYDTVSYNPDETVESEVGGEFVNFDDAEQPGQGPASFIDQTEIPEEELSADALRKKFATYNDPDALEWDNDEDPEDREDTDDSDFIPADETDGRAKKSLRRWFTSLSKPRKIILIVALVL
ncbi:MAG: hypothetical protein II738_02270, partial [Clostridia bacterium]|nr:hypothetical protein [Clostridia bacterium]